MKTRRPAVRPLLLATAGATAVFASSCFISGNLVARSCPDGSYSYPCGEDLPADAGTDAGRPDAGTDGGTPDAGTDGGTPDAGP